MAWKELLTTDIGLLSLGTIVFILGMAVFFISYFGKKAEEDAKAAGK